MNNDRDAKVRELLSLARKLADPKANAFETRHLRQRAAVVKAEIDRMDAGAGLFTVVGRVDIAR